MLVKLREVDGMSRMTFKAFLSKVDRGEIKTYTGIEAEKGDERNENEEGVKMNQL